MIIDVLVCRMDGTQSLEQREVPDDWFPMQENEESQSVSEKI